jgi:hypothetical protein
VITRPGHHLHRSLHRNIDWWAARDAPFELIALQLRKSLQIGKSSKPQKQSRPLRVFNHEHADSFSMNQVLIGKSFIGIKPA